MNAPVIAGSTSLDRTAPLRHVQLRHLCGSGRLGERPLRQGPSGSLGRLHPYKRFFSFAKNLTQQAGDMTHGWRRAVFASDGHTFGSSSVMRKSSGDEIRLFVKQGARCWSTSPTTAGTATPAHPGKRSTCRACARSKIAAVVARHQHRHHHHHRPYGRLTASVERTRSPRWRPRSYRSDLTFYTRPRRRLSPTYVGITLCINRAMAL